MFESVVVDIKIQCIDILMSHILLFPKIYNLAVCQLLRQIIKNRYPATHSIPLSWTHLYRKLQVFAL
jgi:hypothetical protein